jgi:DNA modification methylase
MTNLPQASQIETWLTDKLVFYVRNPRKNDAAVDRMCGSIKEFGFKVPVLARSDGTVVDGHLRIKAARKLGITEIPVILCDEWTESQVKAFRILVNRSATWAQFDEELLSLELQELAAAEFDLGLSGFDDQEVARLLEAGDATQGLNDEDSVPDAPEAPITRPGELWNLGNHKLLIGDATKRADVGRLMGNDTADLVFTDLPYNCAYEGYTDEHLTIQNDRMSDADYEQFLANAFQSYRSIVKSGASLYVCHPSSWQREFQNAMEAAGFEIRCQVIWAKNTFAWGFGRYKFQHEPIFCSHVAGQTDAWYGDKSQSTLWQANKPAANRLHPTMKPVELIERALVNSSKAGDICADFFGGAGSTLIGCERRGRQARLMEIDCRYAQVIIVRWQEHCGKVATLDGDGRAFAEIAQERRQEAA